MKSVLYLLLATSLYGYGFSMSDRYQPESQNLIVLGFQNQNPASPLQFPCLLKDGTVNCDSDFIHMKNQVCQRTLHFKKNINNQYVVSCQLSLSKSLILGMSYSGEKPINGYLHLQMNPQVKIENIMKPRKSGFGYFQLLTD